MSVVDGAVAGQLQALMEDIYQRYDYDFRQYAMASQLRRVRQGVRQFGCAGIGELRQRINADPAAFMDLLQLLTIPVTALFRDPAFFLALRRQAVPLLETYPSLTIWVAGCCTGEEAYSVAILLREEGLLERSMIHATDINPRSLETARNGIFALERAVEYAANYRLAGGRGALSDFYAVHGGVARFDQSLRDHITFADHSLATDAVFAETQLVCCRNVLIYFNKALQDRALGLFHESLCRRGFLGLGSKESTQFSSWTPRFDTVDPREKLYRKR